MIESCQFRNGKCYLVKIVAENWYKSNKSVSINQIEIKLIVEYGLKYEELICSFNVVMKITKGLKNIVVTNLIRYQEWWIVESQFEFLLQLPNWKRTTIKKGINRIDEKKCAIKGGELIPIMIRIYGTELIMYITENIEANYIYNVVPAWMGQDPNYIKIQICKTEQLKEGMGHLLESKDYLWDVFYNFKLFKTTVRKKKSNVPN
jgi:hypothetical protein